MQRYLLMLLLPALLLAAIPGRFMEYPDIRNDLITFSYEGDLWRVSSQGGLAVRLTVHPGTETAGRISPDGAWIAFTGEYDGGRYLYAIPSDGGVPTRLTWHHSAQPLTWTPDGKKVVYRSSYENSYRPVAKLYAVSIEGEWPEQLPVPQGILASYSPDGKKLAYCPKGREEYYWKRYKGGQYVDLWLYDFTTKEYTDLTDYVGKSAYPMWIDDKLYFVSDRSEDGISNLYTYDLADKTVSQITFFNDFDVQMAATDGKQIVYMRSGYLYLLDSRTNTSRQVDIQIPSDRWQLADRTINPKEYIQSMAIAADGKSVAFEARGDVFIVPTDDKKETRNLTRTPGSRERYAQLSPDGRWLAFFSDKSGEYALYMTKADGSDGEWIKLTDDLQTTVYHLEWSPDSKKILFGDKSFTLWYVDVATKKLTKIGSSNRLKNDEFTWEISDYSWAPDSKWIAYSFVQENRNSIIYLYSLEQAKSFAVTGDFYDNLYPTFDANGDYLYYLSYRNYNDVRMDVYEDNHILPQPVQVMLVQLKAGQAPPFAEAAGPRMGRRPGGMSAEMEQANMPKARAKNKETAKSDTAGLFRIDLEGIQDRHFVVPVKAGNYFFAKAGKGRITFASVDEFGDDEYEELYLPGGRDKWKLHIYDVAEQKETVLEQQISDWRISADGESILIKKLNDYYTGSLAKLGGGNALSSISGTADRPRTSSSSRSKHSDQDLGEKLDLGKMVYTVQVQPEWNQIFNDTWRWYRDFFYDKDMHGRDWKKMGETYRSYIPQLNSRDDLNWLLSQMVGELCVSHTYISGGDRGPTQRPELSTFTGLLGADLVPAEGGCYKLAKIYGPSDFNRSLEGPLVRPDFQVREGDYLIAINGREVRYPENPFKYLQVAGEEKVKLTVNSRPAATGAKTITVTPLRSEYQQRYFRWVEDNLNKVLKMSNGEIGYMHITAMGVRNLGEFDKFWRAFRYKKGLIIDVRGNGGGWTEYFLIDKLERKQVAYNVMQGMEPFRYPNSASHAHYAVVTNEANGSDGEAFIEDFKANKLGTVIGVPSWGGLVGIINGQKTIDNGTVHQSNNAFFGREGKWLVENHGADPDILVDNDPASLMAGQDRQLDAAIEVLKKQIAEKPWTFPSRPAYPKK
ncbi:MAG TPA: S41 family peptidase [bacterium]|nr:S41 family peptidase [bacterium]